MMITKKKTEEIDLLINLLTSRIKEAVQEELYKILYSLPKQKLGKINQTTLLDLKKILSQ